MSSLTRVQRKTLSHLRALLRHANKRVSTTADHGPRLWTSFILQEYRAHQHVTKKATARRLRRMAADQVALIQAVDEEQV